MFSIELLISDRGSPFNPEMSEWANLYPMHVRIRNNVRYESLKDLSILACKNGANLMAIPAVMAHRLDMSLIRDRGPYFLDCKKTGLFIDVVCAGFTGPVKDSFAEWEKQYKKLWLGFLQFVDSRLSEMAGSEKNLAIPVDLVFWGDEEATSPYFVGFKAAVHEFFTAAQF